MSARDDIENWKCKNDIAPPPPLLWPAVTVASPFGQSGAGSGAIWLQFIHSIFSQYEINFIK